MVDFLPAREVAVGLFGWQIRWYGVLYLAAFGVAWYLLPKLQKYRGLKLSQEEWLYVLAWSMAGVLLGGRLGFVLFYEPGYFLGHPKEILALWQGGMSWHGGLIGVGLALWRVSRVLKIDFWRLADVVVVPAALGLAVGRLGNVINGELFTGPLAQFLAVAVNVAIAGVLYGVLVKRREMRAGGVLALWLILAGAARFGMEYLREQHYELLFGLTRGQMLAVIVFLLGVGIWRLKVKE